MNRFRIAKIVISFSLLSYLSLTFLRNYNSPENIEKRCILKFEKDFKNHLETSHEEWNQICLLYTSPSPRDEKVSRMPSSA